MVPPPVAQAPGLELAIGGGATPCSSGLLVFLQAEREHESTMPRANGNGDRTVITERHRPRAANQQIAAAQSSVSSYRSAPPPTRTASQPLHSAAILTV